MYVVDRDKAKAVSLRFRLAHPEKCRAWAKAYREANPDKAKVATQRWRDANRDRIREKSCAWAAANRDVKRSAYTRWRAQKLRATPAWANQDLIFSFYRMAEVFGLVVDHIVPLQSKLVCGLHVEHNLQLLTASENGRKGNKLMEGYL